MSVRPIAQQDPVMTLTARLGDVVNSVRFNVTALTTDLRDLDKLREQLAEHEIAVDIDFGPIGNAAAAARRDLERETGKPTFSFPKPR